MDFPLHFIHDIQAKYFRTGLYTHLDIFLDEHSCDSLVIRWTFTFQDLGCTHSITRAPVIDLDPEGNILVDGHGYGSDAEMAERAIFHGHYEAYVREMYREEGVDASEVYFQRL